MEGNTMKGYVQVYTGDGKGKTTAALGLAIRAAGAGMKVFFAQFIKGKDYSEIHAIEKFSDAITLKQYGQGCWINEGQPDEEDVQAAKIGLEAVKDVIRSGNYQLVILDEANIAVYFNLFPVDKLIELINCKPDHVELVITGRRAHPLLIEHADLVTEMKEIKHYYNDGVQARVGVEV
jgi:cob(I)alamin adenosyltransferase